MLSCSGDSEESASGVVEYTYSDVGTNPYNVNVLAYSSTNDFASTSQTISVFVLPALDPDITGIDGWNRKVMEGKCCL